MGCFCGGAAAVSDKQEVPAKLISPVLVGKDAVTGGKTGAAALPPEDEDEQLIKAAAAPDLPPPPLQPCPSDGLGWDEVAPSRVSEAGLAQLEELRGRLEAADVQPAGAGTQELQQEEDGGAAEGEGGSSQSQHSIPAGEEGAEEDLEEEEAGMAIGEQQDDSVGGELDALSDGGDEEQPEFPPAPRAELLPLANPEDALLASLACLDTAGDDPSAIIAALHKLRRLAIHHSQLLLPYLGALALLLIGYVQQEEDAAVSVTASMLFIDLIISYGDRFARHCDDRLNPQNSLLLALIDKSTCALRPATSPGGGRPGTAAARRAQEQWQASPAGMTDLALRVMVDYCSQPKMISLLQAYTHFKQPARIRSAASALLVRATYHR